MTREELKKVSVCVHLSQHPLQATTGSCGVSSGPLSLLPTVPHLQVLVSRYPQLTVVSDRLLDIYCQLTGERHSVSDDGGQQEASEEEKSVAPLEGRALSLR